MELLRRGVDGLPALGRALFDRRHRESTLLLQRQLRLAFVVLVEFSSCSARADVAIILLDNRHELVLVLWQVELLVLDLDLVSDRSGFDLLVDCLAELLRSLSF